MQSETINIDSLPAEAEAILRDYTRLQAQEKEIRDKKLALRQRLDNHLPHQADHETIWSNLDGKRVKISRSVQTKVDYNEELLQQRLGDKYTEILMPDMRRIRKNMGKIKTIFQPVMTLVGAPDRLKVKQAIDRGVIDHSAFTGTYEKTDEVKIAVMLCKK